MPAYRKEIAHPDPERAVRIAILTSSTAIEAIFLAPGSAWDTLQPISDATLVAELARASVAYLKHR